MFLRNNNRHTDWAEQVCPPGQEEPVHLVPDIVDQVGVLALLGMAVCVALAWIISPRGKKC